MLWRNPASSTIGAAFSSAVLDRPESNGTGSFQGQYLGGGTADGVIYHNLQADDLVSHFGKLDCGLVLFGFVRAGHVYVEHGDDRRDVIDNSTGLVLFDCDRPITTQSSSDHDICYLAMPRSTVMAAIFPDSMRAMALRALSATSLTSLRSFSACFLTLAS